jgi:hypothetical protein
MQPHHSDLHLAAKNRSRASLVHHQEKEIDRLSAELAPEA